MLAMDSIHPALCLSVSSRVLTAQAVLIASLGKTQPLTEKTLKGSLVLCEPGVSVSATCLTMLHYSNVLMPCAVTRSLRRLAIRAI